MSDLFGAPSGVMAFHKDEDQQVETQQRFATMQHLGAMTEQAQMTARAAAVKMQRDQQMMQIASQVALKGGQAADQMSAIGTQLVEGGYFKEGSDLVNKASEIQSRAATAATAAQRAKVAVDAQALKKFDS